MSERTYHGQQVQVIAGEEVILMPDAGVARCCPLCAFYRPGDDESHHNGCIVPKDEQALIHGLRCGVDNAFYVKANDVALHEYQHLAVLARLNNGKFTPPEA